MKEYVKIEDETHFLTRCPKFSGERDDLFNSNPYQLKLKILPIYLIKIEKASEMQEPSCKSKSFGLVL